MGTAIAIAVSIASIFASHFRDDLITRLTFTPLHQFQSTAKSGQAPTGSDESPLYSARTSVLTRRLHRLLEFPGKEAGRRFISFHPMAVQKKVVNLVREDQLFERDISLPERLGEDDCLRKVDVAVVIAMNQKNW